MSLSTPYPASRPTATPSRPRWNSGMSLEIKSARPTLPPSPLPTPVLRVFVRHRTSFVMFPCPTGTRTVGLPFKRTVTGFSLCLTRMWSSHRRATLKFGAPSRHRVKWACLTAFAAAEHTLLLQVQGVLGAHDEGGQSNGEAGRGLWALKGGPG